MVTRIQRLRAPAGDDGDRRIDGSAKGVAMPRLTTSIAAVMALSVATAASAQSPSSAFDRGHGRQTWQDPGYAQLVAACKAPPKAFGIPISTMIEPPKLDFPAPSAAID